MHPALARALASAQIDDQHRAAARWHTIRLAHRAAHEPAWTSCAPAAGMMPTETAQAAPWPCQSVVDVPSGPRAGIDLASRSS